MTSSSMNPRRQSVPLPRADAQTTNHPAELILQALGRVAAEVVTELSRQRDAAPSTKALGGYLDWLMPGASAAPAPIVTLNPGVAVSNHAVEVIRSILADAGEKTATITSGRRTVEGQANAMYKNLVITGVARQRELYGVYGDHVIDAYEAAQKAGKSPDAIVSAMVAKINEIGPTRVSNHLNPECEAVDVATSSIDDGPAFIAALQRAKDAGKIRGHIVEGRGMAFHLDVSPPA